MIIPAIFKLILNLVRKETIKTLVNKAVFYLIRTMDSIFGGLSDKITCDVCKYSIIIRRTFRLHDPDRDGSHTSKYFYRYDQCEKCGEDYKIEFFTEIGELSGAKSYSYPEHRLEGFCVEDFNIEKIIAKTNNDPQIIRLKRKCRISIEENVEFQNVEFQFGHSSCELCPK